MRTIRHKIILTNAEPGMNPTAEELAKVVLARIGLMPRKQGATEKMHHTMLELYERAKRAGKEKKPELGVMTVEEMGLFAGITRQTMYDYLGRWLALGVISKASYIHESKVVVGYKLNGNTLEQAFDRARQQIHGHLETTERYITELQKMIKNEKISMSQKIRTVDAREQEEMPQEGSGLQA